MSEEVDVLNSKPEGVVAGIRQIASAVLGAPAATPAETSLALAVLEATSNPPAKAEPRESASIAATFNAHMDAVLDAANGSARARDRTTRRAHMARAINAAHLVLMDKGVLTAAFLRIGELSDAVDRSYSLPADVQSAARFLDEQLEHATPEHALQWSIVRKWMTPDAALSDDNSDASRG